MQRRLLIQTLALVSFAAGCSTTPAKSLQFLLTKQPKKKLGDKQKYRLRVATLDYLGDNYGGKRMQFWDLPFEKIDFDKRLSNIIYWIDLAIQEHQKIYPVDPIWVLAQMMAESLFYEFALSPAHAGGICQFMPRTASLDYQMLIAGSQPSHHQAPYLKPELAGSYQQYRTLIKERNQFIRATRKDAPFSLKSALQWLAEGKTGEQQAKGQLDRLEKIKQFNTDIRTASKNYQDYIETNIRELGQADLFKNTEFFLGFDERFTYRKPIFSMVHMLAKALQVRNGNILAAAAAYNAGLSRTYTSDKMYKAYGRMPNFDETSLYLSRILANYEEIAKRFYA